MHWRLLSLVFLTPWLLASGATAEDVPARHTVQVELESKPEFILNGGPKGQPLRLNIDAVVTATPPVIAKAVQEWTGIADRGKAITVKFLHNPANSRFVAMSHGDGYSVSATIEVAGKTLVKYETHARYDEVRAVSDEETFCVLGLLEFENRVTERRCIVICQIDGQKPGAADSKDPIIHPTGTATWIGPIVSASSSPLVQKDADGKQP